MILKATATGRVINLWKGNRSPDADRFSAWIKLEPESWNGRVFRQYVKANTTRDAKKMAKIVKIGEWVTISGEATIESFEDGPTNRPTISITGRMTHRKTPPRLPTATRRVAKGSAH